MVGNATRQQSPPPRSCEIHPSCATDCIPLPKPKQIDSGSFVSGSCVSMPGHFAWTAGPDKTVAAVQRGHHVLNSIQMMSRGLREH